MLLLQEIIKNYNTVLFVIKRDIKPKNITYFFSLKDRLKIQYANKERAQELRYRSEYLKSQENLDSFADIFDGG